MDAFSGFLPVTLPKASMEMQAMRTAEPNIWIALGYMVLGFVLCAAIVW
jgi:hypothetical protein